MNKLFLVVGVSMVESVTTRNFGLIYMDTIEFSNLNMQSPFHKQHIGKSVLKFRLDMKIVAYHYNGKDLEFGVALLSGLMLHYNMIAWLPDKYVKIVSMDYANLQRKISVMMDI